jgi:hypothetical protein
VIFIAALPKNQKNTYHFFVMPRYSYREHYIFSCHLEYQKELLSSFLIPFTCNDSSDDESSGDENDHNSSILLKTATYSLLEDSRYLFCSPASRPDIRGSRQGGDVPRLLRIINGEIYLNIGWPASVHDERVWSNTTIARNLDNYFSPGEYLLADSAFSNHLYLVVGLIRMIEMINFLMT